MKYGRTETGQRWHILDKDGQPLCVARSTVVESRDSEVTEPKSRCENCDQSLRLKGQASRRAMKLVKPRQSKDAYEPRHRFKG